MSLFAYLFADDGYMIFCAIIVFLFSFHLLYDTHAIMERSMFKIESDYIILGSIMLYMDLLLYPL